MADGILRGDTTQGWWIESAYPGYSTPELITNRYAVYAWRNARQNYGPAGSPQDGQEATYHRDSAHDYEGKEAVRWSVYTGNGSYLEVTAAKTAAQTVTPLSCPKVRKGIETRYRSGVWEKYLKQSGWVRA